MSDKTGTSAQISSLHAPDPLSTTVADFANCHGVLGWQSIARSGNLYNGNNPLSRVRSLYNILHLGVLN